jgi:hypothetical protein
LPIELNRVSAGGRDNVHEAGCRAGEFAEWPVLCSLRRLDSPFQSLLLILVDVEISQPPRKNEAGSVGVSTVAMCNVILDSLSDTCSLSGVSECKGWGSGGTSGIRSKQGQLEFISWLRRGILTTGELILLTMGRV